MKVAILSCGPSIRYTWNPIKHGEYERILAINQAANDYPCHWSITSDRDAALKITRKPLAGMVWRSSLSPATDPRLEELHPFLIDGECRVEDAVSLPEMPAFYPPTFSIQDALLFAWCWLGAREMTLYGCDMVGPGGLKIGGMDHYRLEERWINERKLFKQAVDFIRGNGGTVHHVGAEEAE